MGWRPKQCGTLFAAARRWLDSVICLWEADCRTKGHKHSLNKGLLPLHTRRRVIEAVPNDILGLRNKPKAAVRSVRKLTGPKKEKKKKEKRRKEEGEGEEEKKRRRRRRKEEEKKRRREEKKKKK